MDAWGASPKMSRFPLLPAAAICLRAFGGKVPHIAMSATSSWAVCLVPESCKSILLQSYSCQQDYVQVGDL